MARKPRATSVTVPAPEEPYTHRAAVHQSAVVIVMAVLNGLGWPTFVSLDPDGGVVRSRLEDDPPQLLSKDQLWNEFLARHAGVAAERYVLGSLWGTALLNILRAEVVLEMLWDLTKASQSPAPRAFMPDVARLEIRSESWSTMAERPIDVAENLVHDNFVAILHFAAALESSGHLEGESLRAILLRVLPAKQDRP